MWLYNQMQIVGMKAIGNFQAFAFEVPILADVTKG
jgi:hypothetical protein